MVPIGQMMTQNDEKRTYKRATIEAQEVEDMSRFLEENSVGRLPFADCLRLAEEGNSTAQNLVAFFYEFGLDGVTPSPEKAAEWYRRAAEQGDADAQFNLGDCYECGTGVELSTKLAAKWYRFAAEQGHKDAKAALARLDID